MSVVRGAAFLGIVAESTLTHVSSTVVLSEGDRLPSWAASRCRMSLSRSFAADLVDIPPGVRSREEDWREVVVEVDCVGCAWIVSAKSVTMMVSESAECVEDSADEAEMKGEAATEMKLLRRSDGGVREAAALNAAASVGAACLPFLVAPVGPEMGKLRSSTLAPALGRGNKADVTCACGMEDVF
jgi:hypothetical protein